MYKSREFLFSFSLPLSMFAVSPHLFDGYYHLCDEDLIWSNDKIQGPSRRLSTMGDEVST